MKLLMFHSKEFWYKPYNLNSKEKEGTTWSNCIVVFIQVEENDEDKNDIVGKVVGNIRWIANKNNSDKVVLHSFAHLSNSKSDLATASDIIQRISEGLKKHLSVHIVSPGQFYEFSIHVHGPSLAKVFKDL